MSACADLLASFHRSIYNPLLCVTEEAVYANGKRSQFILRVTNSWETPLIKF